MESRAIHSLRNPSWETRQINSVAYAGDGVIKWGMTSIKLNFFARTRPHILICSCSIPSPLYSQPCFIDKDWMWDQAHVRENWGDRFLGFRCFFRLFFCSRLISEHKYIIEIRNGWPATRHNELGYCYSLLTTRNLSTGWSWNYCRTTNSFIELSAFVSRPITRRTGNTTSRLIN